MSKLIDRLSTLYADLTSRSPLLTKSLVAFGLLWSSQKIYSLFSFTHVHFLRRSTVNRFLEPSTDNRETWALITGSSDGIGKGFAEELCSRGVNVILHGRNEPKLERLRDDLLHQYPTRQIRLVVLDAGLNEASDNVSKLTRIAESLKDINLRILINNVGGMGTAEPLFASLTDRSSSDVDQIININIRFHTEITRVLLPQLQSNHPSLILNIGSGISELAAPYAEIYCGTKSYLQAWSRSLRLQMLGERQDVEVLHLQLGGIQSNTSPRPTGFFVPSSRKFAKYALKAAGCGRDVIWPYWPHALQFKPILALPEWIKNRLIFVMVEQQKRELETLRKST